MTEIGKSYWNGTGFYQKEYEELQEELIPQMGKAESEEGELLRSISRLYYDYCNNGNGNVFNESWGEVEINPFFQEFIDYIDIHLYYNASPFKKLDDFINSYKSQDPTFSDEEMNIYDRVVDSIMEQIIEEKNTL